MTEGLSALPRSENYVLGMYAHFTFKPRDVSLADFLLEDPTLLEREIWRFFEVEGGGELSLAAHDKYSKRDTWSGALLTLAERGHLSRERLLDASLGALERDFAAFRAGWFSRFHEALAPTHEERRARLATYLRLLASVIPATASFALNAVRAVDASSPLTAQETLSFVAPALVARQKGTAMAALKLLGTIAKREPGAHTDVARAAVAALAHEAADVQGAALDVIDAFGRVDDAELAQAVTEKAALVAASAQKRLAARGVALPTEESLSHVAAADPSASPSALTRLDPSRALTQLATLDEVIDRLAHILEDDEDPDEVELALEGIARLGVERPPDFERRVGPLRKRAHDVRKKHWSERPIAHALAGVALAWFGEPGEAPPDRESLGPYNLFAARALPIAAAAQARAPLTVLSTPTHRGGWIDPRVLADRVSRLPREAALDPHDAAIALLRLAPEERAGARRKAAKLRGELGEALRYALGGDESIGPTAALWVAAARARAPREGDVAVERRHPRLGPDAGKAARWTWQVTSRTSGKYTFHDLALTVLPKAPAKARTELPSVLVHHASFGGTKSLVRWAATVWPGGTESLLSRGIVRIGNNLDWWNAAWPDAAYLEVLGDRFTPFEVNAAMLLALGLAAKEPGESGLSVDAAIAAFEDGRLAATALGASMAALLPTGLVKAARWAKTLGIVAASSAAHAAHVATAIQRALRGDSTAGPRDEGTLVLLLRELLIATNSKVSDAEAWAYLAASRHRSKLSDVAP